MSFSFLELGKNALKQDEHNNSKRFKLGLKHVSIIGIVLVMTIGMGVYIYTGLGKGQSSRETIPMTMHIQSNLNMTMDQKPIIVPSQIGINQSLWNYHALDKYGPPRMAPLFTKDNHGVIHIESSVNRNYALGEFFKIWGVDLNGKTVKAKVNGQLIP